VGRNYKYILRNQKMEKEMKGTDGLSGLPEDPGHYTQDLVPKRVIHEPVHGKIELDWKPVNWVWQGKIRG
jgi:hypothetical protein